MYVVIAGGGQVGAYLARRLVENKTDVAVIDGSLPICSELADWGKTLVIHGDCTDVSTLIDAGVEHADCVASMTGDDAVNLVTCQLAKAHFHVKLTVSRINDPNNEPVFRSVGVDFALNATEAIASAIQEGILVNDLIPLATVGKGQASLVEIRLADDSPAVGQSIGSLPLPKGSIICAVLRNEAVVFPHGDTVLSGRDQLVSLVARSSLEQFRKVF